MQKNTLQALKWIVGILSENEIPYRIGGGLAANIYGFDRPVNDIDISLSGKHFAKLVPLVQEYIVVGPKHYENEKWKCDTLSLQYYGQDIDLTDADTLLMSSKHDGSVWIKNSEIYQKYPDIEKDVNGIKVNLMHPRVLIEYKQELSGDHQEQDIAFLQKYIETNNL